MTAQLRRAAEKTMLDRGTITRDPLGPESRTFDENTMTYGPPPTATTIYGPGRCSVTPDTDHRASSDTEGGQDIYRDEYRARIPLDATAPEIGDWFTVTAVAPHGDQALVGRSMQITEVVTRSRAVTRQLRMVVRTRGPEDLMAGRPGRGGDTSGFDFDDGGAINELATTLTAAGVRAGAQAHRITQRHGVILHGRVKANAAGRPGPRMQTGDYNRSISLRVAMDGSSVAASVGTNRPQGRRLEFGFVGTDSIGRTYDQPAYPHFGPAHDQTAPEYVEAIAGIADGIFDTSPIGTAATPGGGNQVVSVPAYTKSDGTRVKAYTYTKKGKTP